MFYHTETKPQTWRAVAAFEDGSEGLLCLARSSAQLRDTYAAAFSGVLDWGEQARVCVIRQERREGAPDRGRWVLQGRLTLPVPAATAH